MEKKAIRDEVLVGIDYGESNIGLALGRNGIVTPIKIVDGKDTHRAINDIFRFAIENKADRFIMGLPLDHSGRETKQSLTTRTFAKLLKIRTKKPLEFFDETGSSLEALEESIDMGTPMRKRAMKDHLSAAVILHHYYETHA
ncbi:hypothetical protein A2415_05135 [candidate division WWE3 bacterium RIFOXYC1_FULL_39_7]|uniref:Putative pre-16S rRNA nuclease n=1 Tax=candidate division WWE3 bacterium RIFOXYC1_FULL_39_7 TaxID=1802643 RepID=A0A1F4WLS1_UNCKA|nr:MAG: hypothetical protein A2415_05135 [candidate division WWE3 bacterium RIFOXYC1_FULL_39_7]